jgi:hypothetical protein
VAQIHTAVPNRDLSAQDPYEPEGGGPGGGSSTARTVRGVGRLQRRENEGGLLLISHLSTIGTSPSYTFKRCLRQQNNLVGAISAPNHFKAICCARGGLRSPCGTGTQGVVTPSHPQSLLTITRQMDDSTTEMQDGFNAAIKRKRSPSAERPSHSAPPNKAAKVSNSHLQINYLARQYADTLPLISTDDTLPGLLGLIGDYIGVLDRHESMAGNLGARPLGPILIKRFERLFEAPPRVLKTHGKEGTTVTWLDVVEFARHKPEQFNLEKMRDGIRVCQFYTKQSRVEISEEDYALIASGIPQKLIPPQPIAEDEEKELGTLEILENNISKLVQLTDQGNYLTYLHGGTLC